MNYTDRFNELLAEMKAILTEHNEDVHADCAYSLVAYSDGKEAMQAGSGDIADQIIMLLIHMDAVRRIVEEGYEKNLTAKKWGAVMCAMYAHVYEGKEKDGEWKPTSIHIDI